MTYLPRDELLGSYSGDPAMLLRKASIAVNADDQPDCESHCGSIVGPAAPARSVQNGNRVVDAVETSAVETSQGHENRL